ncbi:MAG: hypothetical protein V4737_01765, partial [Curtobacterium sp.]
MFRLALDEDAELRPLESWHAEEFAAHLARARDHIRPWVGPSFVTESVEGAAGTLSRYAASAAADGARLYGMAKRVRRAQHDMIAYVRFRKQPGSGAVPEYVAWYEPD